MSTETIPNSSAESIKIDFPCGAVGKTVEFERQYVIRISRAGKRLGRDTVGTDCTGKDKCQVRQQSGQRTEYDWTLCVYLHPVPA